MIGKIKKVLVLVLCMWFLLGAFSFIQVQAQTKAKKKVNINTASLTELQTLPRIGPKVAQRIINYRKEHGPFKRVEDIMKVRGIGEKTFLRIKDLITVGRTK
ncbi:ComEA family DNA-binding protein [Candidatus Aminicenantes bacterium AC-708-M15]|jgi:comEA protein|nr:ComEA family DNA-binding protein [SCandidatus Aminicenantes bacterium Aminicenantia_JdfR_composite]MCP2597013.1 ComEA family DNA-binding protein [Candidatus Aminicenantes bacterium AC-335-G13]MCP2604472.1 ComEA family DNA-binding protein [Candidatus Aminicenantes bacterium AC-708-M15]MCP2619374.1 ComEA family DNA-binding protein [Candidatus Aminicenantes bacterium AC-335-K20]